jgi:hypothetical protein
MREHAMIVSCHGRGSRRSRLEKNFRELWFFVPELRRAVRESTAREALPRFALAHRRVETRRVSEDRGGRKHVAEWRPWA